MKEEKMTYYPDEFNPNAEEAYAYAAKQAALNDVAAFSKTSAYAEIGADRKVKVDDAPILDAIDRNQGRIETLSKALAELSNKLEPVSDRQDNEADEATPGYEGQSTVANKLNSQGLSIYHLINYINRITRELEL